MWKGRFSKATADLVQEYGESISYDWRLYPHDIAGSIAHARAQLNAGLLTQEEFSSIETGLREIEQEIAAGVTGRFLCDEYHEATAARPSQRHAVAVGTMCVCVCV